MPIRRGLVLLLVVATVVVFVGLVWMIATLVPWSLLGAPSPTFAIGISGLEKNCTYPVAYWREHPEFYPAQVVLGGSVYQAADIRAILAGESQDPGARLQAQLVGVFLNSLTGIDQSAIEVTIFEAYGWMVQHPAGSELSDSEREAGSRLYSVLEAYNLGLMGIAQCQGASILSSTATGTATETMSIVASLTPSQGLTLMASETPTPTSTPSIPAPTRVQPSRTPVPTTEKPAPPGPTETPLPPVPTETAIPPTRAPTSTNPPPPPTPTLTPIPLPSPTLTEVPPL